MSDKEQYEIMIKNDPDFVVSLLLEKNNQLTKQEIEIEDLQQRINKAIEYIETNKLNGNKISEMLCGSEVLKLLEILKGEK